MVTVKKSKLVTINKVSNSLKTLLQSSYLHDAGLCTDQHVVPKEANTRDAFFDVDRGMLDAVHVLFMPIQNQQNKLKHKKNIPN